MWMTGNILVCGMLLTSQQGRDFQTDEAESAREEESLALARQILRRTVDAIPGHEVTMIRLNDKPQNPGDTEKMASTKEMRARIGTGGRVVGNSGSTSDSLYRGQFWRGFRENGTLRSDRFTASNQTTIECIALLQDHLYDEHAIIGRVSDRQNLKDASVFKTIRYVDAGRPMYADNLNQPWGHAGYYVWQLSFDRKRSVLLSMATGHTMKQFEDPKSWTSAEIREFSDFDSVDGVTYPKRINIRMFADGKEKRINHFLITSFKRVDLVDGDPQRLVQDDTINQKEEGNAVGSRSEEQGSELQEVKGNADRSRWASEFNNWNLGVIGAVAVIIALLGWRIRARRKTPPAETSVDWKD